MSSGALSQEEELVAAVYNSSAMYWRLSWTNNAVWTIAFDRVAASVAVLPEESECLEH